jgi:hypothetical protein
MSSFSEFLEVANRWAVWAADMCDHFEDEHDGCCRGCPCTKVGGDDGRCLLYLSNWLKEVQYNDWAQKLIEDANYLHKPNTDWETERSQLMETCDRLAAENEELKRDIANLKHKDIENRVLRNKLTQEVFANLEMQIVLDTQEFYRETHKDEDFCF